MPAYFYSAQFGKFLMERMSGPEFAHFELRTGLFAARPLDVGLFHEDFQAEGSGREMRVTYYFSQSLSQLFVVGGHLLRRGEPTDLDQGLMDAYLESIKAWEKNPRARPDVFPK